MQRVEEDMLGKLKKSNLLLSFIIVTTLISGCSNNLGNQENLSNDNSSEEKNIATKFTEFSDIFSEYESFSFPDNVNFTPTYLSDDAVVFGEFHDLDSRTNIGIAKYNLRTKEFDILSESESKSNFLTIIIIMANGEFVVYEEFDQELMVSKYYLYYFNAKKKELIYEINEVAPIHYTQAIQSEDNIIMNVYNSNNQTYNNIKFDTISKKNEMIEEQNCGFPILFKDKLYYVLIDNQKFETKIIEYDIEKSSKNELMSIKGQDKYISGLYTNENDMFVSIDSSSTKMYTYDVENNKLTYFFESEWMETPSFENKYLTWLGGSKDPTQGRPQYYLFDIKKNLNIEYNDSIILLSKSGMMWVKFKVDSNSIPKGNIFNPQYSEIRYFEWSK